MKIELLMLWPAIAATLFLVNSIPTLFRIFLYDRIIAQLIHILISTAIPKTCYL